MLAFTPAGVCEPRVSSGLPAFLLLEPEAQHSPGLLLDSKHHHLPQWGKIGSWVSGKGTSLSPGAENFPEGREASPVPPL